MEILPTLRQLRYLTALAETKHFGRAADLCAATQSTLSAGIQELERLLGAVLVERTRRRVMLTPLGEAVAARARRLLVDAHDLVAEVAAARAPLSGSLRLGVIPTIAPFLLPRVVLGLHHSHPGLRLILREDLTERLLERLADGSIDAALLALPWPLGDLDVLDLGEDPFLLAAPEDHPLAARARVAVAALANEPLLLLEEGHCLRDHALAACHLQEGRHQGGLGPAPMAASLFTLVQMAAGGLGVTLLPRMAVQAGILAGTGLHAGPLEAGASARRIALAWRASSPARGDFLALGDALKAGLAA